MRTFSTYKEEYNIYFDYKSNGIQIEGFNTKRPYETIDDAVQEIYLINPNAKISIISSKRMNEYILSSYFKRLDSI